MRLQIVPGVRNSTIINDTYNANPDSMMAGLEVLSTIAAGRPKVAVLGNMLEQGQLSKVNHRKVGEKAAELKVDWLVTVGSLAKEIANGALHKDNGKHMKIWSFILKNQAVNFLRANLPRNAVVLVKGSRGAYMERLVKRLQYP
jgi:UDP-N-acetylmuramoyl-tripeptide--D-alanyl-D-alanine ligase